MEDLSKARRLPPEEIEAMRERFKEAECLMDEIISERTKQKPKAIPPSDTADKTKRPV